jgi:membrane fusion protein, heavy metal efflux system
MSTSERVPPSIPPSVHQGPPRGGWRSALRVGTENLLVFAMLGGLLVFGHHTGWKLPSASHRPAVADAQADDWCTEHLVPESICVECNERLLPKPKEFGFCHTHGVAECVIDHPELAQVNGKPRLPRYDTAQAIAVTARPENNSRNTLHKARVQLASAQAAAKAGIDVDVVHERPMTDAITANGEVTFDPARVAHLSSRVSGMVAAVFKSVNDAVQPGEILALVDAAQVGQAKTQLLNSLVRRDLRRTILEKLRGAGEAAIPPRTITEAEAALQEAEIAFVSARQALVNLGFEVPEQLDGRDAKKIADAIRFLGIPASYLSKLPAGTKTTNLLPLRSAHAGVVVSSDIVAGEVVDSTKLLFTIADPDFLWLLLSVRQEDARYVTAGLPVEFRTDDSPREVRGIVAWVSPAIDERTRTLRVCVVLKNVDGRLRDKTYGTGRLILRVEPHAVVVPREAVQSTTDAHFVFVRNKDYLKEGAPKVFHVRQVRIGAQDDHYVELLAGVLPDEVVATKGSAVLLAQLLRSSLGAGCGCHEH